MQTKFEEKTLKTCTFLLTDTFVFTGICYTDTKTCEKVNVYPRKKVEL